MSVIVTVNNDDGEAHMTLPAGSTFAYKGMLDGETVSVHNGQIDVTVGGNSGEIWVPAELADFDADLAEEADKEADEKADDEAVFEADFDDEDDEIEVELYEIEAEAAGDPDDICESDCEEECDDDCEDDEEIEFEWYELEAEAEDDAGIQPVPESVPQSDVPKTYEEMSIEELQEAILEKMRRNGPITDQMYRDVRENVYHNSLVTWVRSFR